MAREFIIEIPDAVIKQKFKNPEDLPKELVRCRDCRFSMQAVFEKGRFCGKEKKVHHDDYYCYDGRKKDA